ncbi:MAG: VOC family protein [Propionicimonas sp.]|uniref:VOC family protein n=1 Tax=Propionicimonas sp. TaxID=1955623 RepID=UPI003D151473
MSITTTTHLNFRGTARQALEFYRSVFGGTVSIATYGDFGMPADVPGADKVVFGLLHTGDGLRLMSYDIPGHDTTDTAAIAGATRRENGMTITDRTFFQSLQGSSLAEVRVLWDALADGAAIIEPLAASAWSAGFGMLTDRYGVTWVVDVAGPGNR